MKTTPNQTAQSLETQSRILKAALRLFNELGSDKVTTHDIAEACGISPGNLYYHFRNKEAIVRALFYQIDIFSLNKWREKSPRNKEIRFTDFMQFYFGAVREYRFFFRDFSMLLANDSLLAREWKSLYNHLFLAMREVLEDWIQKGLIKPFRRPEDADAFLDSIWILTSFSQVHLEARGLGGKSRVSEEGQRYLARFLYPYHTEKGQRALDLYL